MSTASRAVTARGRPAPDQFSRLLRASYPPDVSAITGADRMILNFTSLEEASRTGPPTDRTAVGEMMTNLR